MPFLTAEWRDVVLLTFAVPAARLDPFVPSGTSLDLHEGRALVSLVAFRFADTRLLGLPIPFHRDFPEMNLRFYVRRRPAHGGSRLGVTFLRERVPRAAVAIVARAAYNEPYQRLPMRDRVSVSRAGTHTEFAYDWRVDGRWHALEAAITGDPQLPHPGTEAHFVVSHDWGYTRQRDGSTVEYEVTRPAWRVARARCERFEPDAGLLAMVPELAGTPRSVIVAEGSAVSVSRPSRLPAIV